jgi:Chaperone of endosialidase
MRLVSTVSPAVVFALLLPAVFFAQSPQSAPTISQPRLISISGTFQPANGQAPAGTHAVTLAIYTDEIGGSPVWQETQSVATDAEGRYTLLLGATQADGVPLEAFVSGEAKWLGIAFQGEVEGPRVRITSVPYALHAADAATLGGQPASAYLLNPAAKRDATGSASATAAAGETIVNPLSVFPGSTGALAKYLNNADDLGPAAISELGSRVGINTGAALPADYLHIRFDDPFGAFTGLAVQNLNGGANAASGMLFYDHNGVVSQFQGFNNATHGYVINNVATNGSINFALGGASRFFVQTNGNIGLSTAPQAALHIAKRADIDSDIGVIRSNVAAIKFANNPGGGVGDLAYIAQVVKSGEATTLELGNFNDADDDITLRSSAGRVNFIGTGNPAVFPFPTSSVKVGLNGNLGQTTGWSPGIGNPGVFFEGASCGSCESSGFYGDGDTAAIWSPGDGGAILAVYDEDLLPTTTASAAFVVNSAGNIRVGYGTTGCVLDADGTPIAGVCSSDERLKKDIRPFDSGMLDRALKLRPVYYHWRTELMTNEAIPANAGESYGLIAQQVEKLYPEMVSTNTDGYKAVDYTRLPFVLLGALQEEHAKVQSLEARLAKLESARWSTSFWGALGGLGLLGFAFYRRS